MPTAIIHNDRKKILVAEDEKDLREALFTVLSAEGYEVLSADNGQAALDSALKEHPDLILLDLMMPKMDGHAVLKALSEDTWGKNAKVIVLTALDDMETLSTTMENGGFDYMVKSDWKLEDIVKKVKEKLA
ncbi:response regulator [Candidatus Pacebacteria bacterium]|nr:response regulator [Candidatus Paceibacterota bacterium]